MKEKNIKRICSSLLVCGMLVPTLNGCGTLTRNEHDSVSEENSTEVLEENTSSSEETYIESLINYTNPISTQTASTGLDPNDKNFMSQLVSGSFYIIHDGYYYPAFAFASNYDLAEEVEDYINPSINRQMYFTESNELDIPTLFLGQGDTLVYYDTENLLDYVKWERYKDLGYTIGLYSIQQTDYSKRAFIDLEEEEGCIISGSGLEAINSDMQTPIVSLIKIGNVDITDELIANGLIAGARAGESYDLEVYDGTNYNHYIATSDMHAFEAYEMFASTEVEPLQEFAWKVDVPDYFVDGYYRTNAICATGEMYDGLIRIVRGDSFYNIPENFNEQLLFPYTEEQIANGEADTEAFLYQYSDCDELNMFSTIVVGALGFDDGVEEKSIEDKTNILRTANIKTFDINFPKGETCTITITPEVRETGGDAYVLIKNKANTLTYSAFDNSYSTTFKGDGNTYTLYVSGFWNSYNIRLSNCKQDTSGNSQSVVTNVLTDDSYSLDEYMNQAPNEIGAEMLDALDALTNELTQESESSSDAEEAEISTEEEDE